MQHDPFCKAYYPDLLEPERCAWCMVIRRVREDERDNLDVEYWRGYNNAMVEMSMRGDNDAKNNH